METILNEKETIQKSLEEKIATMKSCYEEKLEDANWSNDRLGVDLVVKETKLKKIQKDCKHLLQRNKQIIKLIKPRSTAEPSLLDSE